MRRLGCFAMILPSICFCVACLPVAPVLRPPGLDAAGVTRLLLAADSARLAAFAAADPSPLRPLFSDSAMAPLLPELTGLHLHHARVEEQDADRQVVHWTAAAGRAEGVLEASGQQRVVAAGASVPAWSRIVRQWYAAFQWSGARWLVVGARDLPPGQWWKA